MFLHSYLPSPILLNLGFTKIYWYGFLVTLGIVLGFFVFYKLARRAGLNKNKIFDLTFWLIIWGVIGGRLYYVLSEISYYWHKPIEIFYIWNGGLGIFGVIIAGILVVFFSSLSRAKRSGVEGSRGSISGSLLILDLLTPALALAQAIGRWGNYFNQELYGQPTDLPWGIPISLVNRLPGYENFIYFHPVFLYESLFCLGLFIFLLFLVCRSRDEAVPRLYRHGFIFLLYLFLYSLWRFFIEFLRIDYQPVLLNLRLGQWTSLVLVVLSVIFYIILLRRIKIAHRSRVLGTDKN